MAKSPAKLRATPELSVLQQSVEDRFVRLPRKPACDRHDKKVEASDPSVRETIRALVERFVGRFHEKKRKGFCLNFVTAQIPSAIRNVVLRLSQDHISRAARFIMDLERRANVRLKMFQMQLAERDEPVASNWLTQLDSKERTRRCRCR